MSRSADGLLGWRRERFPLATYAPLALLLEAARFACDPRGARDGLVGRLALALLVLLQLRLADDLASVARDRRDFPERVMSRAPSLAPFRAALALLGAVAATACAMGPYPLARCAILVCTWALLALVYRAGARSERVSFASALAVLLKYPAIALLLAGGRGLDARGRAALVVVYACFAAYELLHDAPLRARRGAWPLLTVALLAGAAAGIQLGGASGAIATGAAAVHALGAIVILVAQRGRPALGGLRYLGFVTAAAIFVAAGYGST